MPSPRSDHVARAVALTVCPNARSNVPDALLAQLPHITWQLLVPRFERSTQGRLGSTFQITYSVHHNDRDAAYGLASQLVDALEDADGTGVPYGVVVSAEPFGDPTEVRSSDQALNYFQFIVSAEFVVRATSV